MRWVALPGGGDRSGHPTRGYRWLRRRRIKPFALNDVWPVHARGGVPNQHLTLPGCGVGRDPSPAIIRNLDHSHHRDDFAHSWPLRSTRRKLLTWALQQQLGEVMDEDDFHEQAQRPAGPARSSGCGLFRLTSCASGSKSSRPRLSGEQHLADTARHQTPPMNCSRYVPRFAAATLIGAPYLDIQRVGARCPVSRVNLNHIAQCAWRSVQAPPRICDLSIS
jgi:hypothetical protein